MYRGRRFRRVRSHSVKKGLLGAPGFAPTDAVPYGGVAGRHRLAIQADLLAQAARDPGLRVGKLDPLRAHPAVATDHASLPVDQRDRMQRPGQIVPRPLSRSAHAAGPAPTAAAHIASYPAPFQLQPQATLHPVALPFNTHHSEARQAQDPGTIPLRSHVSSLLGCTSRENNTWLSGASGIAFFRPGRRAGRPPRLRPAQAAGYHLRSLYSNRRRACFSDLVRLSAHCTVTCDERLAPLFERSFPAATVLPGRPRADDWQRLATLPGDFHTPAGNVPRYLRSTAQHFPATCGYLEPDGEQRATWAARLRALGSGPKVGICWQGGADLLTLRRAPWELWASILSVAGARFVNLQWGDCSQQLETLRDVFGAEVHDWHDADAWNDLDGTAALIAALDLVISVPCTTVHLAGALGVPVWVPFDQRWGCWWILNGVRSLWYPSVRVFPLSASREWTSVSTPMAGALARLISRDTNSAEL